MKHHYNIENYTGSPISKDNFIKALALLENTPRYVTIGVMGTTKYLSIVHTPEIQVRPEYILFSKKDNDDSINLELSDITDIIITDSENIAIETKIGLVYLISRNRVNVTTETVDGEIYFMAN